MTYIVQLTLSNWMRYGGAHRIDLSPEIYAVESFWHDDSDRSNWGGKSAFVSSIRFVLFGKHPFSDQGAGSEDAWITNGEAEGAASLTLSTGHRIERRRQRGSSTQLLLHVPGSMTPAKGEAAQREIDDLLGLSLRDFDSTLYVGQGEAASFVTDTERRQEMVLDWCSLRPLQKAAKRATEALGIAVDERDTLGKKIDSLDAVVRGCLPLTFEHEHVATTEELQAIILRTENEIRELQGKRDVLRKRREDGIRWEASARALAETARLSEDAAKAEEEAKTLRAAVGKPFDSEAFATLLGAHQQAVAKLGTKRRLAVGGFDGNCPVGSCECPITDTLNAAREANAKALKEAESEERAFREQLDEQKRAKAKYDDAVRLAERAESRATTLREQAGRAAATKTHGPQPAPVSDAELLQVEQAITHLTNGRATLQSKLDVVVSTRTKIEEARTKEKELAKKIVELRGAAVSLGRSGAQRVIGQRMVRFIEAAANRELADAGIKLLVRVAWEREGADKAKECDACGMPFRDGRAKECGSCGTARGKQLILGPFVHLSDKSGAAMALTGFTLRLGASSWIRQKRSSSLSFVVLDEVFGALDKTHRTAVASHLVAMLKGRHGFEQAFVISHERGTLDAMPARIIVHAGPSGSGLEVSR